MMLAALLLALVCDPTPVEECDVIELNTVCDADGDEVLRQLLFWDVEWPSGEYHIRDWKYAKSDMRVARTPKGFAVVFMDGDRLRRVEAPWFKETLEFGDKEIKQRDIRRECDRRKLLK